MQGKRHCLSHDGGGNAGQKAVPYPLVRWQARPARHQIHCAPASAPSSGSGGAPAAAAATCRRRVLVELQRRADFRHRKAVETQGKAVFLGTERQWKYKARQCF